MKQCIDSGLWVPNSKVDDGDGDKEDKEDKEDDPTYEEVKQQEQQEPKAEWPTLIE